MAIYEYKCNKCSIIFEDSNTISNCNAPKPCPKCGDYSNRILSTCSSHFKGNGFYETDYKSKKSTNKD